MEFDLSRSSPELLAADTLASSSLLGTYLSRLSLSRHLPRLRARPALSVFLHGSSLSPGVWNWRWQGKWHALFPGAGLRAPTPRPRVEEASAAGSFASSRLRAQDSRASRATAARAASETGESLARERRSPCASLWSHQGACARRGARAAFFRTHCGLEGLPCKGVGPAGFGLLRAVWYKRHARWHFLPSP